MMHWHADVPYSESSGKTHNIARRQLPKCQFVKHFECTNTRNALDTGLGDPCNKTDV